MVPGGVTPGCEIYVGCVDDGGAGVACIVGRCSPVTGCTAIVGSLGWESSMAKRGSVAVPQRGQAEACDGSWRPQLPQKAIYKLLKRKRTAFFVKSYYTIFASVLSA